MKPAVSGGAGSLPPTSGRLALPSPRAGLSLLKYLPPGSRDSRSCLPKQRLLDCECYDITFCVCTLEMRDAGRMLSSGLGQAEGRAPQGIDSSPLYHGAFTAWPLAPRELTEQGRQPPRLGLLKWFAAVSSPGPHGCQPNTLQKELGQNEQTRNSSGDQDLVHSGHCAAQVEVYKCALRTAAL